MDGKATESLWQGQLKAKRVGQLPSAKEGHPRSAAKSMEKTSVPSDCFVTSGGRRLEDRRRRHHGTQSREVNRELRPHSMPHSCETTTLWLAERRTRHASETLVRVSASGMQAASRMKQEMTRGKMSGARSRMKQKDHSEFSHSCSIAKHLQRACREQETRRTLPAQATSVPAVGIPVFKTCQKCLSPHQRVSANIGRPTPSVKY